MNKIELTGESSFNSGEGQPSVDRRAVLGRLALLSGLAAMTAVGCGPSLQSVTETDKEGEKLSGGVEEAQTDLDDAATKYGEANKELLTHLEQREALHRDAARMHAAKADELKVKRESILARMKDKVLGALNPDQKAALDRIAAFSAKEDAYNKERARLDAEKAAFEAEKRALSQARESMITARDADTTRLTQRQQGLNAWEQRLEAKEGELSNREGALRAEKIRLEQEAARIEALKQQAPAAR